MKLISEEVQNAEYLVEEVNGKKKYKIKGIFLQSDLKNRNGRFVRNRNFSFRNFYNSRI